MATDGGQYVLYGYEANLDGNLLRAPKMGAIFYYVRTHTCELKRLVVAKCYDRNTSSPRYEVSNILLFGVYDFRRIYVLENSITIYGLGNYASFVLEIEK